MKKICKRCNKIYIEDYNKWIEENPDAKYIECCYCGNVEVVL